VFSISVACRRRGELVVGVVYDPLRDELFSAEKGGGARLNGRRISVSAATVGGRALVATGFPFRNKEHIDTYLDTFKEIFLSIGDIRRAGSAAIDLAYVAAGRVDGFFELGLAPWDVAAGVLLITEAGGIVTDFGGGEDFVDTGNIVAGNPNIHPVILDNVRENFSGLIDR